jgi:glycine/D-amino acid oxidase-like deaminating enzyme
MSAIAILGGGIMGACAALYLARQGRRVVVFEEAPAPLSAASRWNEGKIHLGFLYAADPSLETARKLIPGGLLFQAQIEDLLSGSIEAITTDHDDAYLVHRNSVVVANATEAYFHAVARLLSGHPDAHSYFGGAALRPPARMSDQELRALCQSEDIIAGFRAPERSVDTRLLADRLTAALSAASGIEVLTGTTVTGVSEIAGGRGWTVNTGANRHGPFTHVINATWQGLPELDASAGLPGDADYSHRFRASLFVETARPVTATSLVVATGPFGDIKAYPDGRFYLSWYQHGLMAEGHARKPPPTPILGAATQSRIAAAKFEQLGRMFPFVREIEAAAAETIAGGGWVFALGQGQLHDPTATLHKRDRIGIAQRNGYISVNTGKYSIAPWLAQRVAGIVAGDL